MRKHWAWLLFACLVTALPASAQVMQATVKIEGMV
jgi:hypothetical protein